MNRILICSDLDKTILPNGAQSASPQALDTLTRLAARPEIVLVYVSGRDKRLVKEAIREFRLPFPDYAIGDVGTTIYEPMNNWQPWDDWAEEIAGDWRGRTRDELEEILGDIGTLRLQEPEKQNTCKLSYYTDADIDAVDLKATIEKRFEGENINASIIWSIDEEKDIGLVDILPERATKVHAIRFLMKQKGFEEDRTVFAGDSGNDLPALTSGLNAVLVKNARDDVRREAVEVMRNRGQLQRLYLARGNFLGMNGNYCAGVLEGVAHFLPETVSWMEP